eukprot:1896829-Amphidinium_carterae.1
MGRSEQPTEPSPTNLQMMRPNFAEMFKALKDSRKRASTLMQTEANLSLTSAEKARPAADSMPVSTAGMPAH